MNLTEEEKIRGNKLVSAYMGVAYRKWHSDWELLKEAVKKMMLSSKTNTGMSGSMEGYWEWLVNELSKTNTQ